MSEKILDRCPSCGYQTLFIAESGHLTCSFIQCPQPVLWRAIDELMKTQSTPPLVDGDGTVTFSSVPPAQPPAQPAAESAAWAPWAEISAENEALRDQLRRILSTADGPAERRRYALLQAAAVLLAGLYGNDERGIEAAVTAAELLAEIEKAEVARMGQG